MITKFFDIEFIVCLKSGCKILTATKRFIDLDFSNALLSLVSNILTNYRRRHSKLFTYCHVSWDTLSLPLRYVLNLLDYYAATWPYLFIGFAELMIISYVYGFNQYIEDLVEMTGWVNSCANVFFIKFLNCNWTILN